MKVTLFEDTTLSMASSPSQVPVKSKLVQKYISYDKRIIRIKHGEKRNSLDKTSAELDNGQSNLAN